MAGELIQIIINIRHKGIVAARTTCVVDGCVPGTHAGCIVPVLEGQVVLSWRRWGSKAVGH